MEEEKIKEETLNDQRNNEFSKEIIKQLWSYQCDKLIRNLSYPEYRVLEKASWLFTIQCAQGKMDQKIAEFIRKEYNWIQYDIDTQTEDIFSVKVPKIMSKSELTEEIERFQTLLNVRTLMSFDDDRQLLEAYELRSSENEKSNQKTVDKE